MKFWSDWKSASLGCLLLFPGSPDAFRPSSLTTNHLYGTTTSFFSSTTAVAAAKMDQSFPTWRFDKHCNSMEWSQLVPAKLQVNNNLDDLVDGADLILLGVVAPVKDTDDDDNNNDKEEKEEDEDKEEPVMELQGKVKQVDETLDGAIQDLLKENIKSFKNGVKVGSTTPTLRANKKRYIVLGLGNGKDWTGAGFAIGKAIADKVNNEAKIQNAHVLLPASFLSNATLARDMATAFYSELHVDNRYRTGAKIKKPAKDLQSVSFFAEGEGEPANDALARGKQLATGVVLTKDVVNAPHNVLNSESLAETAKRIAKESNGVIQCEILGKRECEERGMGAYLGVARGSETDPQFIHLTYKAKGEIKSKVAVVGKGLLFDTGGYNIKTQMMEYMKFDCGGAAAVLGAARALGMLQPPGVEAHIIVAACENMISQKSYVPSDILTASNGKTIEVMNTDAEGRLTLADALVYADKELGCEKIIELSTLTGACMIALGKDICGLWTDNDDLANEILDISKVTGDKSWRMPLAKEYNEQLESKFADMKNVGTKYGGSITAALFLQNFVSKKKPFAHLDIAGPVWNDKSGASGFGAKLVVEWVTRQGQNDS